MKGFSSFSKSAFWSPFLLGLVAFFALPAVSVEANASRPAVEQHVLRVEQALSQQAEITQSLFLQQTSSFSLSQAVEFCEFFAKPYRLLGFSQPPIRAGPVV